MAYGAELKKSIARKIYDYVEVKQREEGFDLSPHRSSRHGHASPSKKESIQAYLNEALARMPAELHDDRDDKEAKIVRVRRDLELLAMGLAETEKKHQPPSSRTPLPRSFRSLQSSSRPQSARSGSQTSRSNASIISERPSTRPANTASLFQMTAQVLVDNELVSPSRPTSARFTRKSSSSSTASATSSRSSLSPNHPFGEYRSPYRAPPAPLLAAPAWAAPRPTSAHTSPSRGLNRSQNGGSGSSFLGGSGGSSGQRGSGSGAGGEGRSCSARDALQVADFSGLEEHEHRGGLFEGGEEDDEGSGEYHSLEDAETNTEAASRGAESRGQGSGQGGAGASGAAAPALSDAGGRQEEGEGEEEEGEEEVEDSEEDDDEEGEEEEESETKHRPAASTTFVSSGTSPEASSQGKQAAARTPTRREASVQSEAASSDAALVLARQQINRTLVQECLRTQELEQRLAGLHKLVAGPAAPVSSAHRTPGGEKRSSINIDGVFAACRAGETDVVREAILAHPEYLQALDSQEMTLLHVACASGRAEIVKFLLARGADTTLQSRAGYLPIDLARDMGFPACEGLLLAVAGQSKAPAPKTSKDHRLQPAERAQAERRRRSMEERRKEYEAHQPHDGESFLDEVRAAALSS